MWAEGPLDVGPGFETQGPTLGGILRSFFAVLAHRAPGALQSRALFGTGAGLRAQCGMKWWKVILPGVVIDPSGGSHVFFTSMGPID